MGEKFKALLKGISVEKLKKWALPAGGALAATAVIVALLWQSNNHYTTLFGSQEHIPLPQVVEVLSGEQIPYRVEPTSGSLLVREGDLPKARMALAARGIQAQSPAGYELMDREEMLGSSQFIQNIRFKRSLEGELAQSIMALNAVEYARVHLGISETSSFVLSNKPDSTASVMLRLAYGQQLAEDQVAAIVSLVSGSLPGMKSQQVRVVDQHGTLLSAGLDQQSNRQQSKASGEAIQRIRQQTERNLANVLLPVTGADNFRISVVPRLNFSQIEETQERLLGEPRPTNENLLQENTTDQLALGIPGSLSNRPANQPQAQQDKNNPTQLSTRNQTQRQIGYDRDVRHIRHPGYQLEKLTVAVVLNQNAPQIKDWTAEQQQQVQQMLSQAAGIDSARGDVLSLNLLNFTLPPSDIMPPERWWERQSTLDWSIRGAVALLVLLITLFGLLPMMRRIGRRQENAEQAESAVLPAGVFINDEENDEEGNGALSELTAGQFPGNEDLPAQSSGLETKVAFLQNLAQSETDRVAEVIKQWISSNERSSSK